MKSKNSWRDGDSVGVKPARRWRGLLGLAALAIFAGGCRQDMHIQPKYLPYQETPFFADGRDERPVVPGTVARGHLRLDDLLYTAKENGEVADKFPFPMTREDLERGRQRYNIYCTPCHAYTGSGNRAARVPGAPVVSYRPAAASAGGTFLSSHDRWVRFDVQLRGARGAGGSVENRGVHPGAATEPARDD